MSTRILRNTADRVLYPIHWQTTGGTPTSKEPAPRDEDSGGDRQVEPGAGEGDAALRAELEQHWQRRLQSESDESRRQGEAAGRSRALAEVDELMNRLARTIESVAGHKARLRQEAEREIVELSMSVARRILRRQIMVDEEAILGLVKAALDNTSLREVTDVRVHPQFSDRIAAHLRQLGSPQAIQVIPDQTLELGAVLVETSRGCLDASLETQLDEISLGFADLARGVQRRL
jgi:flagellar assembly protein FliH